MALRDDIAERRQDFFDNLGIDHDGEDAGVLKRDGDRLVYHRDPYIGANYADDDTPSIMFLAIAPDNTDDPFQPSDHNYFVDGNTDGLPAPEIFTHNRSMPNHHAVGTYLTTLHKIKDDLGEPYQTAWNTLESFRVCTRCRDDFAGDEYQSVLPYHNDAAHVMSYAAVDNFHMFYNVTKGKAVKDNETDLARDELDYAIDRIEILDPDVLVLQGTGKHGPAHPDIAEQIRDRTSVDTIQTIPHPRALAYNKVPATELVDKLEEL